MSITNDIDKKVEVVNLKARNTRLKQEVEALNREVKVLQKELESERTEADSLIKSMISLRTIVRQAVLPLEPLLSLAEKARQPIISGSLGRAIATINEALEESEKPSTKPAPPKKTGHMYPAGYNVPERKASSSSNEG